MRINKIIRGQRGISADTALRLARYFGMSVEFWTGIQTHYEIEKAKMELGARLDTEVKVLETAWRREKLNIFAIDLFKSESKKVSILPDHR